MEHTSTQCKDVLDPFLLRGLCYLECRSDHHHRRLTLKASSTIPVCILVQVRCRMVSTLCSLWHKPASCRLRSLVDPPALHVMLTATGRKEDMRSIRLTRLLNPCSIYVVRPSSFKTLPYLIRPRWEELKGVKGSIWTQAGDFICQFHAGAGEGSDQVK
jgi:hypothetical protein